MNTQTRSTLLAMVIALIVVGGLSYVAFINTQRPFDQNTVPTDSAFDPLNATYSIDNVPTVFVNGSAETNANGPKSSIMFFGQPVTGDLNGDGTDDAAVYITQDTGGSGTFFYVVAAINSANQTVGTNAVLLGDRIAPQNLQIQDGIIVANYADRKPGDPMTTQPSEGVSAYLTVNGTTLTRKPAPVQEITYLVSQQDSTKYCNGVDMDSAGYQKTITIEKTTSTQATNPTSQQRIKETINLATTGMCRSVLNQVDISVADGIVTIPPIDGWAGVSIAMCSCKPQVEVNMLRIPGITKVIWQ